jgi:uncharacterized damage-inducible protein DinB
MSAKFEDPRYPIGKYNTKPYSDEQRMEWIHDIKFLPQSLENAVLNLDTAQLETPYREGGWTVHQLVHHVADSHINAYCRFKLGLTEDVPTIKTYDEKAWAKLPDTTNLPINVSITLLHALHTRWVELLKNTETAAWEKKVYHPAQEKEVSLWHLLGSYAWHGRHHVSHILMLREEKGW